MVESTTTTTDDDKKDLGLKRQLSDFEMLDCGNDFEQQEMKDINSVKLPNLGNIASMDSHTLSPRFQEVHSQTIEFLAQIISQLVGAREPPPVKELKNDPFKKLKPVETSQESSQ